MEENTENIETPENNHFLTGNKDTDLIVLSKLNNEDLLNACLTNKDVNRACKNESFWKSRFISLYDNEFPNPVDYPSKYKKDSETWRNFYLKFVFYTTKFRIFNYLLRIATFKGDLSLVVHTLNKPDTKINIYGGLPLITSAEGGYDDITKYLINRGATVDRSFLNWICGYGSLDIVKFVIGKNIDMSQDDNYNIRMAANAGRFDIVRELISAGADIHTKNDEILSHASIYGNIGMAEYLLNHGAVIDRPGEIANPLTKAIQYGKMDMVRYLIQRGADVNINNGSPLKYAIKDKNLDFVQELVKNGADVNIVFDDGTSPLQFAKNNQQFDIYQYLKSV